MYLHKLNTIDQGDQLSALAYSPILYHATL